MIGELPGQPSCCTPVAVGGPGAQVFQVPRVGQEPSQLRRKLASVASPASTLSRYAKIGAHRTYQRRVCLALADVNARLVSSFRFQFSPLSCERMPRLVGTDEYNLLECETSGHPSLLKLLKSVFSIIIACYRRQTLVLGNCGEVVRVDPALLGQRGTGVLGADGRFSTGAMRR